MSARCDFIRSVHPYAFRSGEWAQILTEDAVYGRPCWLVMFQDGTTDVWVKSDADARYEFVPEYPRANPGDAKP